MHTIAVIGCGKIGAGVARFSSRLEPWSHAGAFDEHPDTQLVALVDSDEEQLLNCRNHFPKAATFTSIREAINSTHPDLAVVATSTPSHLAIVRELVELGVKRILCEKPLASSPEEAREMVRLCRERGVLLMVNHIRRFDPLLRRMKERLGEIGEIIQITGHYSLGVRHNGVHIFDLLRFFVGDVHAAIGIRNEKTESKTASVGDIDVDGFLFFESGSRAAIQVHDASDYSMCTIDIFGRNGCVQMGDLGFTVEFRGMRESSDFIGYQELAPHGKQVEGEPRNWMRSMVSHVVDVLDGKVEPYVDGEDGLKAVEICEALYASAMEDGKRIIL